MLLKEGRITLEGPFYDSGDSLFVITGGTGKYAGAKGQMTLHDRGTIPPDGKMGQRKSGASPTVAAQ